MERWGTEEVKAKVSWIKGKIAELISNPQLAEFKEFYLMSLMTPLLDELGADPAIIVGGHAVELYTSGSYKTADVDLVMIRDDLARELFDRLGFIREGRYHYCKELDVPIEIPSDNLAGSKDKVIKVNTNVGYCYVIGVEDLILDRLNAAEFWEDQRSLEWARYLMSSQLEQLDFEYMRKRCADEGDKLVTRLEKERAWVQDRLKD